MAPHNFVINLLNRNLNISPDTVRRLKRYRRSLRIFLSNKSALLSLLVVLFIVLVAIFAPLLAPYEQNERIYTEESGTPNLEPPSAEHPLGTTQFGQDVLSQWIWGSQITVLVAALSALSVFVVGSAVGIVAGYYRGMVDMAIMRFVDVLYGLPAIPFILVLALFIGASIWNVILAMVLVLWRTMARSVRSQTLSLAQRPYVKAAKATGAGDIRIMTNYLLPNLLPIILIETVIIASQAIVLEAGVSFLGFGATNGVSWGTMLQASFATGAIRHAYWWVLPPGLSIAVIVVSLFYIARGIEEVTNPELGTD
jgi:peptide/nickel transport system permease protein